MARKIFGKVAGMGGVRSFFGHRTRDTRTRAPAAVVSAALAAALLALAAATPGNALEQKPDLVISHIGPSQLYVGDSDFYHVVVANKGPGAVTLPFGTVLLRDTLNGAISNSTGQPFPYESVGLGSATVDFTTTTEDIIAAGKTRSFDVRPARPSAAGTITNTAQVDPEGAIPEADETNNAASTVSTTVVQSPVDAPTVDLALAISDRPDPVEVRKSLTYTLKVTNSGPDDLPPGAIIRDILSNKVTFRSVEFVGGFGECVLERYADFQRVECRVSSAIGVGESLQAKIRVTPKRTGRLESSANVLKGGEFVQYSDGFPSDTETTRVLRRR